MENSLGNKIRSIRDGLNMSQDRFGKKIGVSGKTVSSYETGRVQPPLSVLEKISAEYNVSLVQITSENKISLEQMLENIQNYINELKSALNQSFTIN